MIADAQERLVQRRDMVRQIDEQIALHGGGIRSRLMRLDARAAVATWHAMIRDMDEFINVLLCGLDDGELALALMGLPVGEALAANPQPAMTARDWLTPVYGEALARRFMITMLRITRAEVGLHLSGRDFGDRTRLTCVADALRYFQSRRRHFVSLLYMMPSVCVGTETLRAETAFDVLIPLVEHCCISFTGWNWKAVLAEVFPDFKLIADARGAYASYDYDPLESAFLEPERVSMLDMYQRRAGMVPSPRHEPQDPTKIFSAAELRNGVRLIQAAYECFGLNDAEFSTLSRLMSAFSRSCEEDFFIRIEVPRFRAILAAQTVFDPDQLETMLVSRPQDFAQASNSFAPFVESDGHVVSNVNLLTRYLNAFKNLHLGSRRRFQIHAGFIFEDKVAADLSAHGFTVTGIKRINRAEFDVVTTRGDTIYNFQCKNNWIDLSRLESDRRLLARYNRSLDRYYRAALTKENASEKACCARDSVSIGSSISSSVVSR
jgi:hypothetical protein